MTERLKRGVEFGINTLNNAIGNELALVRACISPTDQARICPWLVVNMFANHLCGYLMPTIAAVDTGNPEKIKRAFQLFWQAFSQYALAFNGILPATSQAGILTFINRNKIEISGLLYGDKDYCQQTPQIVDKIVDDLRCFQQFCGISDEDVEFSENIERELYYLRGLSHEATGDRLSSKILDKKFMAVFQQGQKHFGWRILPQKNYDVDLYGVRGITLWWDPEDEFLKSVPMADKFKDCRTDEDQRTRERMYKQWFDALKAIDPDLAIIAQSVYEQNPLGVNRLYPQLQWMENTAKEYELKGKIDKASTMRVKYQQLMAKMAGERHEVKLNPLRAYQKMNIDEKYEFVQEVKQAIAETLVISTKP